MGKRALNLLFFATILAVTILVIPSISLADNYGGGGGGKTTTTTTQSSTTISVMTNPEFSTSNDWMLFIPLAALILVMTIHKKTKSGT